MPVRSGVSSSPLRFQFRKRLDQLLVHDVVIEDTNGKKYPAFAGKIRDLTGPAADVFSDLEGTAAVYFVEPSVDYTIRTGYLLIDSNGVRYKIQRPALVNEGEKNEIVLMACETTDTPLPQIADGPVEGNYAYHVDPSNYFYHKEPGNIAVHKE